MTHMMVASPVLKVMDSVRGGCRSTLTDISTITDICEELLFDAVGAFLGLPPTCMKSFGIMDCLLGSHIVNIEATDSKVLATSGSSTSERACSTHDSGIAISLMVPSRKESVCGGAVVIDDAVGQRDVYWGEVPAALISGWSKLAGDQVISQIEAFAALLIRWFFRKAWVGRKALFFQDNDSARFALIKASSWSLDIPAPSRDWRGAWSQKVVAKAPHD